MKSQSKKKHTLNSKTNVSHLSLSSTCKQIYRAVNSARKYTNDEKLVVVTSFRVYTADIAVVSTCTLPSPINDARGDMPRSGQGYIFRRSKGAFVSNAIRNVLYSPISKQPVDRGKDAFWRVG